VSRPLQRALAGLLAALAIFGATKAAEAHKPSDAYLVLAAKGDGARGHLDVALRDLHDTLDLDRDGAGQITGAEVDEAFPRVEKYLAEHLALRGGANKCILHFSQNGIVPHSDGPYLRVEIDAACTGSVTDVDYSLFFRRDPQHHGLLDAGDGAKIFTNEVRTLPLAANMAPGFLAMVRDGIFHIWTGADHLLFLVTLLLPAVLFKGRKTADEPHEPETLRATFAGILKTVTAFTVAHSLTLAAGALGLPTPASMLVESAIAASIVLAALDNVRPLFTGRRWVVAFGLGLLHGFGFSGVLRDLGLRGPPLLKALLAFNGGVEIGQVAVLAVVVPLLFSLRRFRWYERRAVPIASLVVAMIAAVWIVERVTGRELIPG